MQTNQPSSDLVSLEDALINQNTSGIPVKTFVGYNLGPRTFTVLLSLFELQQYTEVANEQSKSTTQITQRKLDLNHASAIAKYILKGLVSSVEDSRRKKGLSLDGIEEIKALVGTQPYLAIPPLVASYRSCNPNGTNLAVMPLKTETGETSCFKIFLNHGDILWIVDGQHRRKGVELVFDFLNYVKTNHRYPSRSSLVPKTNKEDISANELSVWMDCIEMSKRCTVSIDVHLGLNVDQERQLFHDLNNLAKRVEKSLAFSFDGSNPINQFIKQVLIDDLFESHGIAVHEKDQTTWSGGFSRKEIVAINAILFMNKTNINGAIPADIDPKIETATNFWNHIAAIPHISDSDAKQKTVAGQPVVLKAIAKLYYDSFFGKNSHWNSEENQQKLMNSLAEFDFSHNNPIWKYYHMKSEERIALGLEQLRDYLPSEEEGHNRDIGAFDEHANVFRFGAKHNDIYPIIGDMIRWKLGLPSRKK